MATGSLSPRCTRDAQTGWHGPRGRRVPGILRVPRRTATAAGTSTPKSSEASGPSEEESSRAPPQEGAPPPGRADSRALQSWASAAGASQVQQLRRAPVLGVRPGIPPPPPSLVASSRESTTSFRRTRKGRAFGRRRRSLDSTRSAPGPDFFFLFFAGLSSPGRPGWEGRTFSFSLFLQCASRDDWRCARSMHEFSAKDIDGHMICLDKYKWVLDAVGYATSLKTWLTCLWPHSHNFLSQGFRVHRHQRSLAMRQNRRKLHSASRSACPIRGVWFTNPGLPLQPIREAGAGK